MHGVLAQSRSVELGRSDGFTLFGLGRARRAASAIPAAPAQAEFLSYEQIRTMCWAAGNEPAVPDPPPSARCSPNLSRPLRMYLLGHADAYLQRDADRPEDRTCARSVPSDDEVADAIAEELVRPGRSA